MSKILLVIDFINDIVHPNGKIATSADYIEKHQVIHKANQAIHWAREHKTPVVHIKVGFRENYLECPEHSPIFGKAKTYKALLLNSWGTEFHEDMDVQPSDTVIIKHRISALYGTDLATFLTAQQIKQVFIAGVSTNMTVETTTRELHDRDYQVTVIQDACGTATEEIHQASLKNLERLAKICTVDDLST